jgi:xylulokinase
MKKKELFLGLDCSTQSLSCVLIDPASHQVIYEQAVNFERDLPQYHTHKGYLPVKDPHLVHSPPLMWVEALDLLFFRMKEDQVRFSDIAAIGGSGQQHGSIYLNASVTQRLASLDPEKRLKEQMEGSFSRSTAPIWMNSSTTPECVEIRKALGGMEKVIEMTGSNAFERFTGPQIRKFYQTDPKGYADTAHIALVSSFMASLLLGKMAPIDHGDGSGMNLMDIRKKNWNLEATLATAPDLLQKLPPLVDPSQIIGPISPYFVKRYGFSEKTRLLVWSGDNPNSMIGLGLIEEGMTGISLGTSFTYFGAMEKCHVDKKGEGHLFVSPTGGYMSLICFQNGALAIEALRKVYGIDWIKFNESLTNTHAGNEGAILLPYFEPEIVPHIAKKGLHRFDLAPDEVAKNCRAIIEAQMLSMRLHAVWMQVKPSVIYATGGVSNNPLILQIAADVLNCPVIQLSVTKSSALGAALRALHGVLKERGESPEWKEIVSGFTESLFRARLEPNPRTVKLYDSLLEKYRQCEKRVAQTHASLS